MEVKNGIKKEQGSALDLDKTAEHWGKIHDIKLTFWRAHPVIRGNIQRRVTGDQHKDILNYLVQKYFPKAIERGLSLACGHGALERQLVRSMWAHEMEGTDISPGAIENAKRLAVEAGIGDKIDYRVANFNSFDLPQSRYDAVFSFSAAHHCQELEHLFEQVNKSLKPDGLFLLSEYMGPSKFQLPKHQVDTINQVLSILPECYRVSLDARQRGEFIVKNRYRPPTVAELEEIDPSEAVRATEIRPIFHRYFEIVEYKPWGGNILHFLLSGIAGNFDPDEERDGALLNLIVLMEEKLEECGYFEPDCALLVGRAKP